MSALWQKLFSWDKKPMKQPEPKKSAYNLNDKAKEFIKNLSVSRQAGFNDWAVLTHAWHETGMFRKVIGQYNFWGIKKSKSWLGKVVDVKTHEYLNGKKIDVIAQFIDFEKCSQAVEWYCDFIKRLYANAYNHRDIPNKFFEGLINGKYKYATDPKYVEKLINLYNVLSKDEGLKYLLKPHKK